MTELTREERMDLPPGDPSWIYRRGTDLPKGQFTEVLDRPMTFWHGGVVRKIRWCSNGVPGFLPTMQLMGSQGDMEALENAARATELAKEGVYCAPKGAYKLFEPSKGDRDFLKKDKA